MVITAHALFGCYSFVLRMVIFFVVIFFYQHDHLSFFPNDLNFIFAKECQNGRLLEYHIGTSDECKTHLFLIHFSGMFLTV